MKLEDIFGNTGNVKILINLINNRENTTYLSEIATNTGLSTTIVSKTINTLVENGVVIDVPFSNHIRRVRLNCNNGVVQELIKFYDRLGELE
jgi:DNA-binding HxlR family transcriptional regulator